jgi:hypothetical protein
MDLEARTIGRSFTSLLVMVVLSAAFEMAIKAQDLACADLTSCRGAARCGGPGDPVGCTLLCEDGTTIYCPSKEEVITRRDDRGCGITTRIITVAAQPALRQRDISAAFVRARSKKGPKRSHMLLRLAGEGNPTVAVCLKRRAP